MIWMLEIKEGTTASFSTSYYLSEDYYSFAGVQNVIIQVQLGVKPICFECRRPNGRYISISLMQCEVKKQLTVICAFCM